MGKKASFLHMLVFLEQIHLKLRGTKRLIRVAAGSEDVSKVFYTHVTKYHNKIHCTEEFICFLRVESFSVIPQVLTF